MKPGKTRVNGSPNLPNKMTCRQVHMNSQKIFRNGGEKRIP
jgi:hypothetical protein